MVTIHAKKIHVFRINFYFFITFIIFYYVISCRHVSFDPEIRISDITITQCPKCFTGEIIYSCIVNGDDFFICEKCSTVYPQNKFSSIYYIQTEMVRGTSVR